MSITQAILSALAALYEQKFKTFLTLLGIIIGITTLITVVTLIEGANFYVADKVADLGPTVFQVSQFPRVSLNFNEYLKAMKWKRIEYEDYQYLANRAQEILRIGFASGATGLVKYRQESMENVTVRGVTPSMIDIEKKVLQDGRFFNASDGELHRQVAVIGADISDHLFEKEDPIGKKVLVGGREFLVIGTISRLGSVFGNSRDRFVMIPAPTLFKIYGQRRSVAIYCQAPDETKLAAAIDEATHLLRVRRQLGAGAVNTFSITTADTIMTIYRTITSSFFLVTIVISSISLLVGGVVIMNIMLVSVKERTREIGIRKAVGGRSKDILLQFLFEAITICIVGGLIGIAFGLGLAKLVELLTPFPADVRVGVVLLGFAVSTLVGVFFGIYPAYRAADLDPIEALRYE
jgi:putative ABC transport system permease protein